MKKIEDFSGSRWTQVHIMQISSLKMNATYTVNVSWLKTFSCLLIKKMSFE